MSSAAKQLVVLALLLAVCSALVRGWSDADRNFLNSQEGQALLNRLEMVMANRERNLPWSDRDAEIAGRPSSKRQIRYHQCYFNPISCFRRRK